MSYSKRFSEEKYKPISSILEAIQGLDNGASLLIKELDPEEVARARWLIYDWLNATGLKPLFRLHTRGASLSIEKRRARFEEFEIIKPSLPSHIEELLKEALLHDTEEDVGRFLDGQGIEGKERERVLEEWKEVMK